MVAKEQVDLDQPGMVLVESFSGSFLHEAVGRGIAFLLLAEPQAQQDAQPVRFQSQDRVAPREEENFFRPRLTNPRKLLEGFLRLGEG